MAPKRLATAIDRGLRLLQRGYRRTGLVLHKGGGAERAALHRIDVEVVEGQAPPAARNE